ncbi:hypothetical protein Moror_16461 [Moniliophthora roreri MCA 2997]|uniref:Uncharacterized protein n=1 Tax=Moniliophthora roreri (strain MCA 2997) TaxID=1381753 RepID=V2XED9_MONRO|nr:hypothetical protein Moror_16461 [Moniliophthora roreri MCA 2997]
MNGLNRCLLTSWDQFRACGPLRFDLDNSPFSRADSDVYCKLSSSSVSNSSRTGGNIGLVSSLEENRIERHTSHSSPKNGSPHIFFTTLVSTEIVMTSLQPRTPDFLLQAETHTGMRSKLVSLSEAVKVDHQEAGFARFRC